MPTTSTPHSFKDLPAWQRSMRLCVEIYQLTARLPAAERLGLSASLQQAAVALPTVLAGGAKRGRNGMRAACLDGRQSAAELETLLTIVQQIYTSIPVDDLLSEAAETQDMLTSMAKRLSGDTTTHSRSL